MATKPLPSPELLRQLLRYDPETGKLFWRKRKPEHFESGKRSAESRCNNWNSIYAEKEAFTANGNGGYKISTINCSSCNAHRVAYSMHHDAEIGGRYIDHINGNTSDNRIVNLRLVTQQENTKNARRYKSNKSGVTGVHWDSHHKAWSATIGVNGKATRIGRFKKKEDAIAARKRAEINHGFHPNHGREGSDNRRLSSG